MRFLTLSTSPSRSTPTQAPFRHVAPLLSAGLVIGAGGGFVLAAVLSLTQALNLPSGAWWIAVVQAHGHLQLYGWAGLFVLGVALHFLPRLRGAPLAFRGAIPWILSAQLTALLVRAISEPLAAVTGALVWRAGLIASGLLEAAALGAVLIMVTATARRGPPLSMRPAIWSVLPLLLCAFMALGVAALVNVSNMVFAALSSPAVVPDGSDTLNVTLGLFGFLVPMALAMSARSLPLYAGLEAFPRRPLWTAAWIYTAGLTVTALGVVGGADSAGASSEFLWQRFGGLGFAAMGAALLYFVLTFVRLMRTRGHLPHRVARLAPDAQAVEHAYGAQVRREHQAYGPFVALIASAYFWALLGGLLLVLDGLSLALGSMAPTDLDAARHAFAVGFIALLISGVAPRMVPGFSGGQIASPRLVTATLWLGNGAALLRVGSLLLAAPLSAVFGAAGTPLDQALFGLSGPVGWALSLCLLINLWPAIWPKTIAQVQTL